jgi:hypothetical protein
VFLKSCTRKYAKLYRGKIYFLKKLSTSKRVGYATSREQKAVLG